MKNYYVLKLNYENKLLWYKRVFGVVSDIWSHKQYMYILCLYVYIVIWNLILINEYRVFSVYGCELREQT